MTKPLLGAHVSAAGGLYKAIENAVRLDAETIQLFGASPRQWYAPLPKEEDVAMFKKHLATSCVKKSFLHGPYLVNLASANHELREKSIEALSAHMRIAEVIGAQGVIFHMGSVGGDNRQVGIDRTIDGMLEVLKNVPGKTQLIMENSSGGGGKLCSDVEEIAEIHKATKSPRVKVCFDTQHAFAAGVIPEYTADCIKNVFAKWDSTLGLEHIVAMHINDSKTKANTQHDRHENLGDGFIGIDGFKHLSKTKGLHHAAWILEVPGIDGKGPDDENIRRLKNLFI